MLEFQNELDVYGEGGTFTVARILPCNLKEKFIVSKTWGKYSLVSYVKCYENFTKPLERTVDFLHKMERMPPSILCKVL